MFLIGLTGGIACGKSTVSKIFSDEFGVRIIDADVIARKVVEPNEKGWLRIKKAFGDEVFYDDGTLNRDKLGEIIFYDEKKRRILNKCLHGLIRFEILKEAIRCLFSGYRYVIVDVPLLFESKALLRFLSYKIVIFCDEKQQIDRLLKRNPNLSTDDAKMRIKSQMKHSDRIKMADFCIDNSNSVESTREQIKNIYDVVNKSNIYIRNRIIMSTLLAIVAGGFIFCIKKLIFI